jgi:drug/metabolite transporter (DMT)-like permease
MGALGLALFSALSWGTADFFGGLTTRRFGILLVGVISQGAGLILTGLFIVIGGSPMPDERGIAFGVAAGLCATIGLGALYQGLAVGPMSVVAPITALEVVVPVTVGFVRGDRPDPVQIAGIVIGVVGVVMASRETAADADATVPRIRGVVYGIVAAVFLGLLVTFLNEAGKESAPWAVFTLRLVSVPVFLIALLVTRAWRGRHPTPRDTATMVGVGLLDNLANVTFALAGQTGLLALISVVGSLYPVATVLLAWTLLRERLTTSQWVGVALAFAGVGLIAAG